MNNQLLIFFFLFLSFTAVSQTDLQDYNAFFQKQSKIYGNWLSSEGFSPLEVYSIKTTEDRLSLYLAFPYEKTDSTAAAWKQVKRDFEAKSPLLLEEQLLYKAVQLMSIGQDSLDIQLYDASGYEGGPACFFRGIYFDEGEVKVDSTYFGDCRPVERELYLEPSDFSQMQKGSVQQMQEWLPRNRLYDYILAYAQKRFKLQKADCSNRYPRLDVLENKKHLRFEIKDLCKEVLRDEENSMWCGIVSWLNDEQCNWRRREMLTFTFTYNKSDEGIDVSCRIDGKIGSGVFSRLDENGYHDMEKDFKRVLEKYTDRFMVELFEYLKIQLKED